jgi:polar amino acid transport system permease protein
MSVLQEFIEESGGSLIRRALIVLVAVAIAFVLWNANWKTIAGLDFTSLWTFRVPLFKGLLMTLALTAVAGIVGFLSGTVLAVASQSPIAPLRWLVVAHVEIFRDTPLVVQLMWIHFALPMITGYNTSAMESGVIAIALQASAYFTELVRAGIQAVPKTQWDAAYALGLPAWIRWTRVILPPAIRIIIPPLVNLTISFFKATTILSVLQVGEMMSVASRITNATFRPVEVLTAAAVVYFVLGYFMSRFTLRLERRLARSEAEAAQ